MSKAKSKAEARKQVKAQIRHWQSLKSVSATAGSIWSAEGRTRLTSQTYPPSTPTKKKQTAPWAEIEDAIQEAINLRCDGEEMARSLQGTERGESHGEASRVTAHQASGSGSGRGRLTAFPANSIPIPYPKGLFWVGSF